MTALERVDAAREGRARPGPTTHPAATQAGAYRRRQVARPGPPRGTAHAPDPDEHKGPRRTNGSGRGGRPMTASSWAHRASSIRDTDSSSVGRWHPATLAELTVSRRQLSAALHDGARPAGTAEDAVQRLLLAFEELASNALRHGRLPVEVA